MKKIIIIMGLLLLIASGAFGQQGYIGLFVDATHTQSCATGAGFYPVDMWIWILPGSLGTICADFRISYPVNVIQSTVTKNWPIISVDLGDLPWGYSVCFTSCQYNWVWPAHQLLYVTDPTQTWVEILKHPDTPGTCVQFYNCQPGYPDECATVFSRLGLNRVCPPDNPIGVEDSNWGAIKALYR
jgi:hypothetical protein